MLTKKPTSLLFLKLIFSSLIVSALLLTSAASAAINKPANYPMYDTANIDNESAWNIMNVHDPEIYKEGSTYYLFSTDYKVGGTATPGIQIRSSTDLINWTWVGYALNGVPTAAKNWTGGVNVIWAPEIVKLGSTYYLYYCVSAFGTRTSYIGVATSSSITGPWADQGEVFKTKAGDGYTANAIDPNVVIDSSGVPWMSYGSFFGGIFITQLNPATGKFAATGQGTLIAARSTSVDSAVEGPNIVYNATQNKYYLFVSYDSCCNTSNMTYNVRVGRSSSITGPYLDYNGNAMTNTSMTPQSEIGTKVLGGYGFAGADGWYGTGHNTILQDGSNWYMIHHARGEADKNWTYLHVRKMLWSADGWPLVSPERFTGEVQRTLSSNVVAGTWESIVLDRANNSKIGSSSVTLLASGKIGTESSSNFWTFTAPGTLKLNWYAPGQAPGNYWVDTVQLIEAWDWELGRPTYVYTGLNQSGTAVWGKKISAPILSGATYKLVNVGSWKSLDVASGGIVDGTNVQIWADNNLAPQIWRVTMNSDGTYKLINPNSGKALDVAGGGTANGTNVQIWADNGLNAQKWNISLQTDGTYKLINPASGKALDIANGGTSNGSNAQIWEQNTFDAQKWVLLPL